MMIVAPRTEESASQGKTDVAALRSEAWYSVLRRYLSMIAIVNLFWELAQLPLYTIWTKGTAGEIAFAVLHCTGGDVLIAGSSLLVALLVFGNGRWPAERYVVVATATIVTAVAFTVYSEWRNVEVLETWAYSTWMPTLPPLGTGLSPLAQWIIIPVAAFWWAGRDGRIEAWQSRPAETHIT